MENQRVSESLRGRLDGPMLLKEIFEEQMGWPMDAAFLESLAAFNGHLFAAGLAPVNSDREGSKE